MITTLISRVFSKTFWQKILHRKTKKDNSQLGIDKDYPIISDRALALVIKEITPFRDTLRKTLRPVIIQSMKDGLSAQDHLRLYYAYRHNKAIVNYQMSKLRAAGWFSTYLVCPDPSCLDSLEFQDLKSQNFATCQVLSTRRILVIDHVFFTINDAADIAKLEKLAAKYCLYTALMKDHLPLVNPLLHD